MMKPRIIHGPRSVHYPSAAARRPVSTGHAPRQNGELFIGEGGAVFVHREGADDELVIAPKNMIVLDAAKSATTRRKREVLARLRLLIEMRDCARRVLQASDQNPSKPELWLEDQKRLRHLYDVFVQGFGPIHKLEKRATSSRDENGIPFHTVRRPNLIEFHRDPHAHVLAQVEHYDAATGMARLAPSFAQTAHEVGAAKVKRVKKAQSPAPLRSPVKVSRRRSNGVDGTPEGLSL